MAADQEALTRIASEQSVTWTSPESADVASQSSANPGGSGAGAPQLSANPAGSDAASQLSAAWTGTTGSKDGKKAIKSAGLSLAALRAELASEVRGWPGDLEQAQRTVESAFGLVRDAASGCMFVIASSGEVAKLKEYVQHSDKGYLTKKLKDQKVWSEEFRRVFLEFATHTLNDRWPEDHHDADARNLPKDGAIVLSSSGSLRKAAAKLHGLPAGQHTWPAHGTRHMAGLQVAVFLDQAVVIIKSDSGELHVLFGRPDSRVAVFHVRDEWPHPGEPTAAATGVDGVHGMPGIEEVDSVSGSEAPSLHPERCDPSQVDL